MTTEEKFHAAVNVIRSLPKNGSYQPSNELMLRFYAFYKQATEGPCSEAGTSKPAFWDVVGRAKHTAWARLKNMSREEAMKRYVDELHRIVETMSYTDNVASFMQAGDQEVLDNLPMEDLELIAGDCLNYVRSQPGSPLPSRPTTPTPVKSPGPQQESDDEEFIDSVENEPVQDSSKHNESDLIITNPKPIVNGGYQLINNQTNSTLHAAIPNGVATREISTNKSTLKVDISAEIARTVASLQSDFKNLDTRLTLLEQQAGKSNTKTNAALVQWPKQITMSNLSPALIGFIFIWPFVAIRLSRHFSRE